MSAPLHHAHRVAAELCGRTLAHAHAKSGDAALILMAKHLFRFHPAIALGAATLFHASFEYGVKTLRFDAGTFAHELVEGVIGCMY
jgi:hypothetical protein